MMPIQDRDPFKEQNLQKMQLSFYLLPVIGTLLSLWLLYSRNGNRQQQEISRLSVTLTLIWLIAYGLLGTSFSQSSEIITFRLVYANAIVTSGYFFACLVLTIRLWQGKSLYPFKVGKLTDRFSHKN
jgi:hypothetical protein